MIHRLAAVLGLFVIACGVGLNPAFAATYTLNSGERIEGEAVSFDERGVVFKKPDGSFQDRIGWTNFTQTALKQLSANPKIKPLAEAFLEPDEAAEKEKAPVIEVKPKIPDRLERPDPDAGLGALFSSSVTLLALILLYVGNIYAGYEVGVFRNYHPAITCAVAAVAPIVGPILFLCLPTRLQKSQDQIAAESMAAHMAAQQAHEAAEAEANQPTPEEIAAQEVAAAAAAAAAAQPQITTYTRGQITFNRRFFETKFAGFLRMTPGEAERDKVIYIKSARGEHVGSRLTRLEPAELHLQIRQGTATADVMIPFNEIYEVQIRPVDVAAHT